MMTERFENDRLYSSVAVYCVYPNQSMNLVQRGEGVSMLSFIFVLAFSVTTAFLSILRKVRDCLNNQMFEKYVFCKMATKMAAIFKMAAGQTAAAGLNCWDYRHENGALGSICRPDKFGNSENKVCGHCFVCTASYGRG